MSADNIIAVKKLHDGWWVAYGFASDDNYASETFMRRGQRYSTRELALTAAHDLEQAHGYVEYGVNECEEAQP